MEAESRGVKRGREPDRDQGPSESTRKPPSPAPSDRAHHADLPKVPQCQDHITEKASSTSTDTEEALRTLLAVGKETEKTSKKDEAESRW